MKRQPLSELHTDPVQRSRVAEYERKRYARRDVFNAIKRGDLVKPGRCNRCQQPKASRDLHGHHEDYDKPLEVEWLCQQCHSAEHPKLRRGGPIGRVRNDLALRL
jgi:hypothetical protein